MKTVILLATALSLSFNALSQTKNQSIFKGFYNNQVRAKSEAKEMQIFAEINPQFIAFGGFGAGAGLEFSKIQTGVIFLKTKLTPTFRDAIFENAQNLDVPNNGAAEVFANVFLRKDRKGFYAGTILSYDWYSVTDVPTQKKEDFNKVYVVSRAGFRWFPFKEVLYVDGGYGVSFNVSGSKKRELGSSTYSPKSVLALPFFAVGGRFLINKSSK